MTLERIRPTGVGRRPEAVRSRGVGRRWHCGIFTTAIAAGALALAACGGHPGASPPPITTAASSPADQARGAPLPGPFPGLLLIADRGNSRLLLVDGKKRILWSYPRPGSAPRFPFRYDDDAFFCPGYQAIISSQEMQHTIQVISFPGERSCGITGGRISRARRPGT